MHKILCIGEALIDMICTDRGSSLADGNNFLKKPGGAPTNVAAAIAALGGKVDLAAKVGVDPFGKHLIEVMNGFGVNTKWMLQDEKHFTTFAFVSLMENGERDFYFNRGADGQLSKEDISEININDFSIVHFGSATGFLPGPLQEAYHHLLQLCIEYGVMVSFDPNYRHLLFKDDQPSFIRQSWQFIEKSDFFKVSDEEAMLLTDRTDIEQAAAIFSEKTSAVFAITLGEKGTLLGYQGKTATIGSIPVKSIDTTGAGDAFVGAVLYQLSLLDKEKISLMDAEQWSQIFVNANKAGARTCEYTGAMEAFKFLSNSIFN